MARRKRQPPSLKRRKAYRSPKRRFIIYCEGDNTEPTYFGELQKTVQDTLVELETVPVGGVPRTVADKAVKRAKTLGVGKIRKKGRDSFESRDQVWAVFDRDDHPNYKEAIDRCKANKVKVGSSNPCFELWLILHLEEFDKPDGRNGVQRRLEFLCPEYDRRGRKLPNCQVLVESINQAEDRAEQQLERRRQEQGGQLAPPYTTVWKLTRAIRSADDT